MSEAINKNRKTTWRKRLDFVYENGENLLSEWEQNFVDDLTIRFEGKDVELSFKQSCVLTRIYEKVVERLG